MASKLESFLKDKKIDPRRIAAASQKIEKLRPEDRSVRLQRRLARKSEDGGKKKEGEVQTKPRSGRAVTQRSIDAALAGKALSGSAKTRLLRALNAVLEQKKQEKVDLRAIFELPSQGNPPKEKKKKEEG